MPICPKPCINWNHNTPFQYSLHILQSPEAKLEHKEFLADPNQDPRRVFIETLLADLPESGTILVYNQSFEAGILTKLGKYSLDSLRKPILSSLAELVLRTVPTFFVSTSLAKLCFAGCLVEHQSKIETIHARFFDLMKPFQRRDYYHPDMQGSHSIKKVLPALVPELSYNDLDISEGASASRAFVQLRAMENSMEIESIRTNLLEYCKMDTLAMVEIWRVLVSQVV
jgi:hypothetical protein